MKKLLITALLIFFSLGTGFAQEQKVDIPALINETQIMIQSPEELKLAWWIPEDFWRASFAQSKDLSADRVEEFLEVVRPYTLVVVIDGNVGAMGGVTYNAEADTRANIRLVDSLENAYRPLPESMIDADAKNFLSMMKPVFANLLGPLGENMNFFLFPAKGKNGKAIANATQEGAFMVRLSGQEFKWELPLGSLLAAKACSVDGKEMNGAWSFCPWHGVALK